MKNKISIVLSIVVLFSISFYKLNDNNKIIGNWYFLTSDSSYCEAYISKSKVIYICDNGYSDKLNYDIFGDSVILINEEKRIPICIYKVKKDKIELNFNGFDNCFYHLDIDTFDINKLNDQFYFDKFLENFLFRRNELYEDSSHFFKDVNQWVL